MYARVNSVINISGLSRGPLSSAAPVLGRALERLGTLASKSAAKEIAV
jgi:hypothetical protein